MWTLSGVKQSATSELSCVTLGESLHVSPSRLPLLYQGVILEPASKGGFGEGVQGRCSGRTRHAWSSARRGVSDEVALVVTTGAAVLSAPTGRPR